MSASFEPLPQMHGVLALDKPAGVSSAQCLAPFKRQGQKKIGHAGTLDPMAAGALLVLLGEATKLSGWLLKSGRKVYSGSIRLGVETDTWDMEGRILREEGPGGVDAKAAAEAVAAWTSQTEQTVPAYSAAKHRGQPLYKLAREGRPTPVKIRPAQIFEAAMLDFSIPFVKFRVACGSGVYIRSLAHSLGVRLGCGAALQSLTREYSHPFSLAQCCSMDDVRAGRWPERVSPLQDALPDWPRIALDEASAAAARNGAAAPAGPGDGGFAFLCQSGRPIAIGRAEATPKGKKWVIERGLWNF